MIGKRISQLPTPALLIDQDTVVHNLTKVSDMVRSAGKKLRPHIKTHKIPAFAKMQIDSGAVGICTAKVSEAEVMAEAGIKDILVANEIVGADKLIRLAKLAKQAKISVLADSIQTADWLGETARDYDVIFHVLVEVDTGDARCGALPEFVPQIAKRISQWPNLHFAGLETFGGAVFHCQGKEEELRRAEALGITMKKVKSDVEAAGLTVEEVSVGGSPAISLLVKEPLYTELRPGVYIFNDAATVCRGAATYEECAATVLTTVISRPTGNRMVVDGGAKTFSYCRPGVVFGCRILHGVVKGNPSVCLSNLSEEHGVFETEEGLPDYCVGEKIQVLPAHICPVINLFNQAYLIKDGIVQDVVSIAARGMSE